MRFFVGGAQDGPVNTAVLLIGAPQMVSLILENPKP